MTYEINYILNNKKRSLFTVLGISFSFILLLSIGILFSSLRQYLIENVKREIGDYHVIIKGKVSNENFILKKQYMNNRYYVIYKDIYKVYNNTDKICQKEKCETITYNDSLLSLYGLSKNNNLFKTFKNIIIILVTILSIIIFFIIYNSFKASLNNRKKDVSLFKLIGMDNSNLYKLFLKEGLILGLVGMVLGFLFSLIINFIFFKIMNNLLYEIFNSNLKLNIYMPFMFIPVLFMFLVILLSSLIPLKNLKKYKAMELFRKNEVVYRHNINFLKIFIVWYTYVNYKRQKEKYKSLIICVFVAVFSINVFSLTLRYGLECVKKYVIMPEYDLSVTTKNNYQMLSKISKDLKSKRKLIFRSCEVNANIPEEYFLNGYSDDLNIMATDIGGDEVINRINKIEISDGKINHINYKIFKNLNNIILEGDEEVKISNLVLTNSVPFGFNELNNIVINLNKDEFNKLCTEYTENLYLKTDYKGLNNYMESEIKENQLDMIYLNVKKSKQITNNLIFIIKIFLYGICVLVFIIMIFSTINTVSINIDFRKSELSSLQSIGLEPFKINLCFFLESLIISFKGWFYAIPFIFIVNKYLYSGIRKVFNFEKIVLSLDILFLSLLISFIIIFVSMLISHKDLRKMSIISNIKG